MTPLESIIEAISNIKDENRQMTMSAVDVANRLSMNQRLQHNFTRLDAQVDTLLRQKHGECYEAPDPLKEEDMANHINSPTINIGIEAAKAMADATSSSTSESVMSKIPNWLKSIGLLALGAGAVYLVNTLFPGADLDTRNVFDLQAVPFDPTQTP